MSRAENSSLLKTIKKHQMPARHGGRRAGAGRPLGTRNAPRLLPTLPKTGDPLQWLLNLMQCQAAPLALRVAAARAALPYQGTHAGG